MSGSRLELGGFFLPGRCDLAPVWPVAVERDGEDVEELPPRARATASILPPAAVDSPADALTAPLTSLSTGSVLYVNPRQLYRILERRYERQLILSQLTVGRRPRRRTTTTTARASAVSTNSRRWSQRVGVETAAARARREHDENTLARATPQLLKHLEQFEAERAELTARIEKLCRDVRKTQAVLDKAQIVEQAALQAEIRACSARVDAAAKLMEARAAHSRNVQQLQEAQRALKRAPQRFESVVRDATTNPADDDSLLPS